MQGKFTLVEKIIKQVKEKEGIQKVGVIGYCFGGGISVEMAGKLFGSYIILYSIYISKG